MKKILIVGATIILVLILGIGGKIYMDKQVENEEILKAIAKDKEQIEEIARWNIKDVKTITFEWIETKGDGSISVELDKSLTTTPVGGNLSIHWYLNDDKSVTYRTQLSLGADNDRFDKLSLEGRNILSNENEKYFKISDYDSKVIKQLVDKIQESDREFAPSNIGALILGISDIEKLKLKGMTEKITAQQIIEYWEAELNG